MNTAYEPDDDFTPAKEKPPEHTPGPWEVSWSANEIPGNYLVHQAKVGKCCDARTHDANTRLIAAAPELLEALKVLTEHASEHYPHFESRRGQADIKAAIAAIAKATGE